MNRPTLALALACLAGPAFAGDTANIEVLGFSADGHVFAFEEYGIQDGSGFPYANRFYLDTTTDSFLPGTPIRVRIDDEAATIEAVRGQARTKGEAILGAEELAENPGFTVGWNAVTEHSADPFRMSVSPRPYFPTIDRQLEFRLEEFALEGSEMCRELGDTKGFRLLRMGTEAGTTTKLLHEDKSIPQGRDCPLGYRLGGVQTFYPDDGAPVFAVLIAVRRVGFEGPDHRWMAVTGKID